MPQRLCNLIRDCEQGQDNTLVGNSNNPPRKKLREPILHYIIYCCILGNNKRPIDFFEDETTF